MKTEQSDIIYNDKISVNIANKLTCLTLKPIF